jgi:hypothetical protein
MDMPDHPLEGNRLKEPVNHPGDAIIDIDGVAVAEQLFAAFLNPHVRFLRAVNHEAINFVDRLVENAAGLEHRPFVHANNQGAEELIKVEFDEVSVRVPNLQ